MCLGTPGRIVALPADAADPARALVDGVVRDVDLSLLDGSPARVGDWVLIHLGFALEPMTDAEVAELLDAARLLRSGAPAGAGP
jgi:hydrogenase expression/formation protein HypC